MRWLVAVAVAVVAVEAAPQAPSESPIPTASPSSVPSQVPTGSPDPVPSASPTEPEPNPNACGQIDALTVSFKAANPAETPAVPAQLAFDCLQSVPNKQAEAGALVRSLRALIQLQSSLPWLKDPPDEYNFPPTDIEGLLSEIEATMSSGGYASEYDFQADLFRMFSTAHDGHFVWVGDVFKAFVFRNELIKDLVSISLDGQSPPQLFHKGDLVNGTDPSPVMQINGQEAVPLLQDLILELSRFQDPDSMWNSQFATFASPETTSILGASLIFQGASVTLTYANGTERTQESIATLRSVADFTGVFNGEDFYQKFCNPDNMIVEPEAAEEVFPPEPTISGYPQPVVRDETANQTHGYFLEGEGYEDTAVLVVAGFSPPNPFGGGVDFVTYLIDFQTTLDSFFEECRNAGKTNLIVDLTSNGGGLVIAGFELVAQFFPNPQRFTAANIRLADSLVTMARIANSDAVQSIAIPDDVLNGGGNVSNLTPQQQAVLSISSSPILSNFIGVEGPLGENLTDVDEVLGPVALKDDSFTAYQSFNFDSPDPQFNLTGIGSRANTPDSGFTPNNIALLTDGTCGSTCTLVAYQMLGHSSDIKFIAAGGRPRTGRMQSIAGVEGAQLFPFSDIVEAAQTILSVAPEELQDEIDNSDLGEIARGYAVMRQQSPSAGAVNGKNAFSMSDSRTPLQFLRQDANCRIFYTPDMISDVTAIWKRAKDAAFTNPARFCVEGSIVENTDFAGVLDPLFRLSTEEDAANILGGSLKLAAMAAAMVVGVLVL